ncbi:MAG: thermonuclease family protein [Verrucomicrobiota bacterium]
MSKRKLMRIVVALVVAGLAWFAKEQGWIAEEGEAAREKLPGQSAEGEYTPVAFSGAEMELLEGCELIGGRNNDGDSFHVRHSEGETEFRLYFVDTPESAFKTYGGGESNGERIREQGEYFGGLGREETTTVGKAAKGFVKKVLGEGRFKVLTKWEDVYGPDRKYALVVVEWEGDEVYLHELLVGQGLGRIHTRGADLPKGRSWREQKDFLKGLERKAREDKVGAWSF